jgi:putative lipase involved disintegration of autophagic bodies
VTTTEQTRTAATLALLGALLAALLGLSKGLGPVAATEVAGAAYAAALALLVPRLHVSVPAVILHSAKVTGLTAVASAVVFCSGTYAVCQLLRNRGGQ